VVGRRRWRDTWGDLTLGTDPDQESRLWRRLREDGWDVAVESVCSEISGSSPRLARAVIQVRIYCLAASGLADSCWRLYLL
jgi:hypothetical protein